MKSDFVAAVSHDFRTPLASFRQLSELLVDDRVASEEDRKEYLRRIYRESGQLRRLVEELLDFARIDAGARGTAGVGESGGQIVRLVAAELKPNAWIVRRRSTSMFRTRLPTVTSGPGGVRARAVELSDTR